MFTRDHSFGLVALCGLPLDSSVPPELHLDPARSAVRGCPLQLDEGRHRSLLGELAARRLEGAGLTFVAQERDMGPGREAAVREADALFRALQLVGFVPLSAHPVWVGGRTDEDGPVPETVGELRMPRVPPGAPTPALGWVELAFALRLREGLRDLEDEAPSGPVQRALATFTSGTHRTRPEERVHEFVRALEALIAPVAAKGGYRRTFRDRAGLFFGADHGPFLDRLYEVKRRSGHARRALDLYEQPAESGSAEVALWHDAVTAEILVRAVLQRVLLTPPLCEHLADEARLERFWSDAVADEERLRLWGRAISVGEARLAFRRGRVQPAGSDL
jgi:hypothetical protein